MEEFDMGFKLGAIPTDILKNNFERSLELMKEDGLEYADIEDVFGKIPGTHTDSEHEMIKILLDKYCIKARCIGGFTFRNQSLWTINVGDRLYRQTIDELKRQIELAHLLNCPMIRTLFFSKQACIWGRNGAELRNGYNNASWPKILKLFYKPLQMVEDAGLDLVFETGVNTVLTSGWLNRKFVEDMGSKHLKVLWDPANMLINREYPSAVYAEIKDIIAHIHIKDGIYNANTSTIIATAIGNGDMAQYMKEISDNLKKDNYQGVISIENFYIPPGKTTEEGYRAGIGVFKKVFGETR